MEEIALQAGALLREHIIVEEEPAELLSRFQDLTAPRPSPSRVGGREVEKLQSTFQRPFEASLASPLVGSNRSLDLAPDVRHLLHQR
jgi:hypothetical protein